MTIQRTYIRAANIDPAVKAVFETMLGSVGVLFGGGTGSSTPVEAGGSDEKFLAFWTKATAASATSRGFYLRHDIAGAAATGEALRAFTDLTAAAATAHGAHISVQAGSAGYVSGLAVGVRAQLFVKDSAVAANGTYYAGQSEVWSAGASSSLAAVTKHAIHSFAATGNATGMATVLNCWSVDGTSAADTTKMISTVSLAELPSGTVGIATLVNGTRYFVPAVVATAWN